MGESKAFANDPGKREKKSMLQKRLGASFWRDEFQWVREGEDLLCR